MADVLDTILNKVKDAMAPLDEWGEREAASLFFRRRLNIRDSATGKTKVERLHETVEEMVYDKNVNSQVRLESAKFLITMAKSEDDGEPKNPKGAVTVPIQININGIEGPKKE